MKQGQKQTGYIVACTHWDREWRYPVWKNRVLLVEFMDKLLDLLAADGGYRNFVLDGQCAPVEDYLQIRPEREQEIRRLVEAGRLSIGPWYTLPDLYPIDGECLVRNLLKGIRFCRRFGAHLQVGYNSFGWGQTAQFPQIYKEFDIDFIIAGKHVSPERAPQCEFLWEAPDGTRVLTSRLGEYTRVSFYVNAYQFIKYGIEYESDEYRFDWRKGWLVCHKADTDDCHEDYFKIDRDDSYFQDKVKQGFEKAWRAMDATAVGDCRLLMAGSDFSVEQPELTRMIRDANELFQDREFLHASLEQYAAQLKQLMDTGELRVVKGELRDGPPYNCSANALATRIYLKQLNKRVQNCLLRRAEPFAALLSMMGYEYPKSFLEVAWKYVLLSHPHDSINGVTQDKTADDVVYRLNQALEIGNVVYEQCLNTLVKELDLSGYETGDLLLLVVNVLPRPVCPVMKVCIDTPQDDSVWDFTVTDCAGHAVAVQHVSRRQMTVPVHDPDARPWPFYVDRHIAYLNVGEIPACGFKVLKVEPKTRFDRRTVWWPEMRTSAGEDISRTPNTLENDHLKVTVAQNGSFDIEDKATGQNYNALHYFEDAGDNGNYWIYYPPYSNLVISSLGCSARIRREDNGPLSATLCVEINMRVPARCLVPENGIGGSSERSSETKDLLITSWLTLKAGAQRLEIRTRIVNTAEDHRLRVMFPTEIDAQYALASGHFTVDRRPVSPVKDSQGVFWPEMQTLPMQHFVDLSDGQAGFAFISNGLTEYEAMDDGRGTLAVTLFRSVRNIISTEARSAGVFLHQKGGQCLRTMEFEYALYPHSGGWEAGRVYQEADTFNCPPSAVQISPGARGKLPPEGSFFSVEPDNLVLSACKKAEDRDSYIIRLFNPTNSAIKGRIKAPVKIKGAYLTSLNEVRRSPLPVENGAMVNVHAAKQKIVTVELEVYPKFRSLIE